MKKLLSERFGFTLRAGGGAAMRMSSLELVTEIARHIKAQHLVPENLALNLAEEALVHASSRAARLAMDRDEGRSHENIALDQG
jgi:hypothetical protein